MVIETGSISQAARISYITQPTVTNQIRQLEEYFGMKLFNREYGRISPTEAGAKLYPFAKEMIDTLENSREMLRSLASDYESALHIGATLTIGEFLLPKIIGDFQRQYKNIKSTLLIGNTPEVIAKLENNDIDIALVEGIVTKEAFQITKFSEDELVVVIPNHHAWAGQEEISIQDIPMEKMIWREPNSGIRKIIEDIFIEHKILHQIKSQMELGSTQAIKSAVEAGLGISILPSLSIQREVELGLLRFSHITEMKMTRDLSIIRKPTRFPKENVRKFTAFLNEKFE